MTPTINRVAFSEIEAMRRLMLQEAHCQVRFDACHTRGWADHFAIELAQRLIGYGSVKGRNDRQDRDAIFEFFVLPPFRHCAAECLAELVTASRAIYIECQTNLPVFADFLPRFEANPVVESLLFADQFQTRIEMPDLIFRRRATGDSVFEHHSEPVGGWVVQRGGEIVATGDFLSHYNPPFSDLHMEVRSDCRRQGVATFLVQEIKRECYLACRVPAARCNAGNTASQRTLERAGFQVCGRIISGKISAASGRGSPVNNGSVRESVNPPI